MTITTTISGRDYIAEFIRSEDAGYQPGKLLLDMPNGDHISVYKFRSKWVEAYIVNGICRRSVEHATRQAALDSAAMELASATIESAAFTA
jgi:hypothetical protein